MQKIFLILVCFIVVSSNLLGQYNLPGLTDTINYTIESIGTLDSQLISQECMRLNFEDCNLEIHQSDSDGNWRIYAFWNYDLSDCVTNLSYSSGAKEWVLSFITKDSVKVIKSSTNYRSGMTYSFNLYSERKEKLEDLRDALLYSARRCKGLDRFKNR